MHDYYYYFGRKFCCKFYNDDVILKIQNIHARVFIHPFNTKTIILLYTQNNFIFFYIVSANIIIFYTYVLLKFQKKYIQVLKKKRWDILQRQQTSIKRKNHTRYTKKTSSKRRNHLTPSSSKNPSWENNSNSFSKTYQKKEVIIRFGGLKHWMESNGMKC